MDITAPQPHKASPLDNIEDRTQGPTSAELLAHISQYCQIPASIPPQLRKAIPMAIDKSIREIIGPVVERSVTIACITTKELITKDFAMEPDENKMKKSAYMMVQHLASSLALVTCKEPLRVSMSNHLHSVLSNNMIQEQVLDNMIQTICADNLDLACSIIEKSATEKATAETDEQLAQAYAKRRAHRENPRTASTPFIDASVLSGRYPLALPEALRPKSGGLLAQQLRVYEDFARLPRHTAPVKPPSPNSFGYDPRKPDGEDRTKKRFGKDEATDPAGFRELITDEWLTLCQQTAVQSEKVFPAFIAKLQQQGILKGEDALTTRFFQICIELAVESSFVVDPHGAETINYHGIDTFSKLIAWIIKYLSAETGGNGRIQLFTSVITIVIRVLTKDYEVNKTRFNQRPYFRIFSNWLIDLLAPDPVLDPINPHLLLTFSNKFYMLSPCRFPGFAFAWLELISHRMFMPKLLLSKSQKGWPLFQRLLVELFKFLEPYLRTVELTEPIRVLYKGTLRVLLVLLHDFPEFLCDNHFSFCDVIPTTCIQMRNLILSAFPRNMRLPDPFTPNLKVDLLPEISQPPRILSNYTQSLTLLQGGAQISFKQEIDTYLKTRLPTNFFVELPKRLLLPQQEAAAAGTKYNIPVINSLVLYLGTNAIAQLQKGSQSAMTQSTPMEIFQNLAQELDTEGRYLFLNAIANQLRYPNNHTHYFSCVLLYLFAEAHQMEQPVILEQITRVLLERLIANRPHPWGLLITFIELIKNPRYNFWSHSFTRLSPEIERLFDSVARSCIVPAKGPEK